jgi:hypothetical protein
MRSLFLAVLLLTAVSVLAVQYSYGGMYATSSLKTMLRRFTTKSGNITVPFCNSASSVCKNKYRLVVTAEAGSASAFYISTTPNYSDLSSDDTIQKDDANLQTALNSMIGGDINAGFTLAFVPAILISVAIALLYV